MDGHMKIKNILKMGIDYVHGCRKNSDKEPTLVLSRTTNIRGGRIVVDCDDDRAKWCIGVGFIRLKDKQDTPEAATDVSRKHADSPVQFPIAVSGHSSMTFSI